MNKTNARDLLSHFDFKALFLNELGWDNHDGSLPMKVGEDTLTLTAVAEKRGMAAYLCTMPGAGKTYDYPTRCRIEAQLAKSVREHLIIYVDADRRFQTWQWVKREPGRPIARREHTYTVGQSGEGLLQKLEVLEVKIDEEDQLTLVGITSQARKAFDVDRVTKRFYDRFKTEHAAFLKQIDGIDDEHEQEWYASIMLNRLKFVYFIQKKGFLDKDKDYLRNRLAMVQKTRPKTKFFSFYRTFLLKLFHDGLGRKERNPELRELLGNIPYLNGGIFAVHPLEEKHSGIDIPDKAFEKVFAFFDQYRWHLDERPLRADDEINPDVLGYIFEKYINQKQMGAYYTKEDITEYIAKNCIIPFVFDSVENELKKKGKGAEFGKLFGLLSADPDRYIYDPVKHGVALPLPPEIEKGIDTQKPKLLERRAGWNKPAPSEYALPTEIWREVVARRQRYTDIRARLFGSPKPELCTNDLITLNLNIRQFAQDCIENAETPDVLWAFWRVIEGITVLDPTCGSGAFLFAALNVLEPLYEACLDRMKAFMLEWSQADKVPHPNYYKDFAAVIARVERHANEKYFIFKSIIIRNLYGVDIMDEAVEICKLRLFLKLAAQIEPNYDEDNLGIEPLPDIDFNIRAGNTLVGFATEKQAEEVIRLDLLAYNTVWPEVQRDAKEVAELFSLFRQQQTEIGGMVSAEDKGCLREKLTPLEDRLNTYLADTYGVTKKNGITDWVHSYKPFHWFIEFYEIIAKGGFDVIIGNPPYVEWSKIADYHVRGQYTSFECGNIYTTVCERCYCILADRGHFGMIVPLSSVATDRMAAFRDLWRSECLATIASHYSGDAHPSILFNGVKFRLTILLQTKRSNAGTFTTHFQRWHAEARDFLFPQISYEPVFSTLIRHTLVPKICSPIHNRIFGRLCTHKTTLAACVRDASQHDVFCHRIVAHFVKAVDFVPYFKSERDGHKKSEDYKVFSVDDAMLQSTLLALLNSNLFYCWFVTYSDVYHCGREIILDFPTELPRLAQDQGRELARITKSLMADLKANSVRRKIPYKATGIVSYDEFYPRKSKTINDAIDQALAKHYGFTDEELDFIINYDIKYRMGRDSGDVEEE
ncbi:MAG: DNA methyltransferase [bacterium]